MLLLLELNGLLQHYPKAGSSGAGKRWYAYGKKRFFGTRDDFESILRELLREVEDEVEVLEEKRVKFLTKKPSKQVTRKVREIEKKIEVAEKKQEMIIRRSIKYDLPIIPMKANMVFKKIKQKKRQRREDDFLLILYALRKL